MNGTNHADGAQPDALVDYVFPKSKLKNPRNASKQPVALIACGSFSPITFLHLRMFEMALDHIRCTLTNYEVVGMYMSPVSDAYKKVGLASARARIEMCQLAVEGSEVEVDPWEGLQQEYTPTADVLDHFEQELNAAQGHTKVPKERHIRACLLAGSDLLDTMRTPGVWSETDLDRILSRGVFIIERPGTDESDALAALSQWKQNIHLVDQLIPNEISSTRVRLAVKKSLSINYLLPKTVVEYIEKHGLYKDPNTTPRISRSEEPETIRDSTNTI